MAEIDLLSSPSSRGGSENSISSSSSEHSSSSEESASPVADKRHDSQKIRRNDEMPTNAAPFGALFCLDGDDGSKIESSINDDTYKEVKKSSKENITPTSEQKFQSHDCSPSASSFDSDALESPRSPTPEKEIQGSKSKFFESRANDEPIAMNHDDLDSTVSVNDRAQDDYAPRLHQRHASANQSPSNNCLAAVDPSLYRPPPYRAKPAPMVHFLSIHNRPLHLRKTIPVQELFQAPICNLWHSKFDSFNHLQSEVASSIADSNDNIVVSAPTGAGKTALFEIAMARFFLADLQSKGMHHGRSQISNARKIVYISPSKALCEERYDDWSQRFSAMDIGIQCSMITGDMEPGDSFRDIAASQVILTTPEKWDSVTRRWTEHVFLFGSVKLLLVDEVHLLGDETRGGCLESVICRMNTIQRAVQAASDSYCGHLSSSSYGQSAPEGLSSFMRIVAVSATLPNISNIATFLDANEAQVFDESYRPVPLTTHVVGLGSIGKNEFLFSRQLDQHVPELIRRFAEGKPTIVFCHTKKETEKLAGELGASIGRQRQENHALASQTRVSALQRCLLRGVAYHNAGLDVSDRHLIEKAFSENKISCLCATSTLAMGVNLPAHLVIIKGTSAWRGSQQEIEHGIMLQMIGRAGRPGFDTSGTAVIMTDNASKSKFEKMSGSLEVVESQIQRSLVEVLNSEVSQRVIGSLDDAVNWIKSSFFFSRVQKNPQYYGLRGGSEAALDAQIRQLCFDSLRRLQAESIIACDEECTRIDPNAASHIMSQHLVEFDAMQKIVNLPFDSSQCRLLTALSEFTGLQRPVRRTEKKTLNEVQKNIKYKLDGPPSKVRVQTPQQKSFVLLQASIGQEHLEDFTLRQEMSSMVEYATRMLSAIEEYSTEGGTNGQVALQALRLRRSLAVSLWGASDGVLNQLPGVGHKTTAKLRFNSIVLFNDVLEASSEQIERAAGRTPPFGNQLRVAVHKIVRNTLQLSAKVDYDGECPTNIICTLTRPQNVPPVEGAESDSKSNEALVKYTLACYTDRPGNSLFYQPNISKSGEHVFPCPPSFGKVWIHIVANMVGLDQQLVLDGNDEVFKSALTVSPKKIRNPSKKSAAQTDRKRPAKADAATDTDVRVGKFKIRKFGTSRPSLPFVPKSDAVGNAEPARTTQGPAPPISNRNRASNSIITPSPRLSLSAAAKPDEAKDDESRGGKPSARQGHHMMQSASQRLRSTGTSSIWKQEKQNHKRSQQSAFQRQQDNPFSSYSYDPNDAESALMSTASATSNLRSIQASVIPAQSNQPPTTNGFAGSGFAYRTVPLPFRSKATTGPGTGRQRRHFSSRLPDKEILRLKAEEQQAYADSSLSQPTPASRVASSRDQYGMTMQQSHYPTESAFFSRAHSMPPHQHQFRSNEPGVFAQNHHFGGQEPAFEDSQYGYGFGPPPPIFRQPFPMDEFQNPMPEFEEPYYSSQPSYMPTSRFFRGDPSASQVLYNHGAQTQPEPFYNQAGGAPAAYVGLGYSQSARETTTRDLFLPQAPSTARPTKTTDEEAALFEAAFF